MVANTIREKLFAVLSSLLAVPREQLGNDSSRQNLAQWDSLKHMHLMLALEEEFNIEFDDDEMADLANAGALLEVISRKVGT